LAGLVLPTDVKGVKATLRGIRRTYGSARVRKAPAVAAKMLGMVATAPDKLAGLRDTRLALDRFGGALRRSELVALDVADIAETETGLLATIRGGKTDQERAGPTIAISRGDVACPAQRRGWISPVSRMARSSGRSTRRAGCGARLTSRSVANIVKAYATRAGLDASTFPGHSCEPAS
jgi:site-specific recombinase XerD